MSKNVGTDDYFGIFVDARRRVGGLALLWDKHVTVDLLSFSLHRIDVFITDEGDDTSWRFSNIYSWFKSQ